MRNPFGITPGRFAADRLFRGNRFLLDPFGLPDFAIAPRVLHTSFKDAWLMQVRRSNDDDEAQVKGDPSQGYVITLDSPLVGSSATLGDFVGANHGLVSTANIQGTVGGIATQGTTAAQPRLVNAGALEVDAAGKPAITLNGTSQFLRATGVLDVSQPLIALVYASLPSELDYNFIFDTGPNTSSTNRIRMGLWSDGEAFIDAGDGTLISSASGAGQEGLFVGVYNEGSSLIRLDGSTLTSGTISDNSTGAEVDIAIGARIDGAEHYLEGLVSEMIFYPGADYLDYLAIEVGLLAYRQ